MTDRKFTVVLHAEPEGGYTVLVPALPEIVSFGEDEAEAMVNAREAIELAVEVRKERGEALPEPAASIIRHVTVATAA